MAVQKNSPSLPLPQGNPSHSIYEYLVELNRNLNETVGILGNIRKSPGISQQRFKSYQVELQYLRAEVSQDVLEVMNTVEEDESAKLSQQKREYEKILGDPDDVYFAVRDREEERRKQGLPSLIGILGVRLSREEMTAAMKNTEEQAGQKETSSTAIRNRIAPKAARTKRHGK